MWQWLVGIIVEKIINKVIAAVQDFVRVQVAKKKFTKKAKERLQNASSSAEKSAVIDDLLSKL